MRRIKKLALCLVAVFALSVVAASAASAHTFKAERYTATVKASSTFSGLEHLQGFQASNAVTVCKKATAEGTLAAESETVEVHPIYTECSVALSGTQSAEIVTTGCNYKFVATTPSKAEGKVGVVCSGEGIKVKIPALSCEIVVPTQSGLGTIEYVNQGTGSARKVLVKANVTKIKYKSNCAALTVKEGETAEYRGGKFSAGLVPEMGTGPAEALAEATNGGEPDGIWVE